MAKANAIRFKKGKTKQNHTYETGKEAGKSDPKLKDSMRYIREKHAKTVRFGDRILGRSGNNWLVWGGKM